MGVPRLYRHCGRDIDSVDGQATQEWVGLLLPEKILCCMYPFGLLAICVLTTMSSLWFRQFVTTEEYSLNMSLDGQAQCQM